MAGAKRLASAYGVVDPVFPDVEQDAVAPFLADYRGLTCDALDLRQFIVCLEKAPNRVSPEEGEVG